MPVCGVHSKNQVPLPHLGIMKEVRVCDLCTRLLVQRRAGYRSPRRRAQGGALRLSRLDSGGSANGQDDDGDKTGESGALLGSPPSSTRSLNGSDLFHSVRHRSSGSNSSDSSGNNNASSNNSDAMQLFSPMSGILYSCLLEEQDNTMDEILYLGTFTIGGRSLASRRMSANVALWKDRMFMLTSAEMLCFKAEDSSNAALGEVRSSVHLSDILHIEVNDQFPRILTVIRSDGRVFRIRARTEAQCAEIAAALRKAIQQFQDALYRLQRGPQPEDNSISCVTIQHESSLPEYVVASNPPVGGTFQVELYPSSILRLYVNGPTANGVALYSREMLTRVLTPSTDGKPSPLVTVQADPLANGGSGLGDGSHDVLHVALRSERALPVDVVDEKDTRRFWGLTSFLAAVAAIMNSMDNVSFELLAWLSALVLFLTRFHEKISLLLTTKRFNRSQRLNVTCVSVVAGKGDEKDDDEEDGEGEITAETLDDRFIAGCNGDVEEAKRRYAATMKWRKENGIDKILLRPSRVFDDMKETFTHYTHKKDKYGHPVTYEFLGTQRKTYHDFLARGVSEDEAITHHVRLQEFLWSVIDSRPYPQGNQIKIYDIRGIGMSDLASDVVGYTKKWGETLGEYNPERVYQVFIINPPSWFNLIWKIVSPLLNPKTRERIHVLRGQKDIAKALLEFIPPENLPVEYGGTCACAGGCTTHSPEEVDLREWTHFINSYEGEGDPADDPAVVEALDKLKAKYSALIPLDAPPAPIPEEAVAP